jgi:D-beta-D-heptose 7-phosphate kinase/D-beta-D-heptose 1-phosphate adenosyltransferase
LKNIWTNGCYDILHIGHIRLFEFAKSLGDKLIVGIDSDNRIKKSKGNNRPINNQEFRKEILQAVRFIDEVYIFYTDDELCNLIKQNSIDTIVVGTDYKDKDVVGSQFSKETIFFPRTIDISTSKIYEYASHNQSTT